MSFLSSVRLIGTAPVRRFATVSEGLARMNIYKDAEKAPKELADEEYPQWLWKLKETQATLEDLTREANSLFDEGGYEHVIESMPADRLKRLFTLDARERIKTQNAMRKGGRIR